MEKLFKLKEHGTSVKVEILAGLTTFMTMAYILIVNPLILSDAGMDFGAIFTATAIASAAATLVMAIFANLPFALAPGKGLNAFFAYTVVIGMGYSWQLALTAVLIEGVIFLILTVFNIREAIINFIPLNVKKAISVGIGLLDDLDKELERRGLFFCRYADDCNIYLGSRRAGERVLESITRFLEKKLRLKVNGEKTKVDRPWNRTFLGYSMTSHMSPRLKVSRDSVKRFKGKVKVVFRMGRGRSLARTIETLRPILRGWFNYFKLAEVKNIFEELDGWLRRKLRCLLWRQWKRPRTRVRNLLRRGLDEFTV